MIEEEKESDAKTFIVILVILCFVIPIFIPIFLILMCCAGAGSSSYKIIHRCNNCRRKIGHCAGRFSD